MRILVIGGTQFIGPVVVRKLVELILQLRIAICYNPATCKEVPDVRQGQRVDLDRTI